MREGSWKKVIEWYHADRVKVRRMGEEKSAQDAELMAINVSHAQLQGKLKEQTYILSSTKKKFGEMYNRINYLEKKVVELKKSKKNLEGGAKGSKKGGTELLYEDRDIE
uniref:Uncharacterized protein n=1 Tax=Populus alba TaxID=43335 RepID=A0A4U5R065_POPAL|nr:hypothetical protein D5086_0000025420 [Populus alba]